MNGPYSSFLISRLKVKSWGIMGHFDSIFVNNFGIVKMGLVYKCSERQRTSKNFCCHETILLTDLP